MTQQGARRVTTGYGGKSYGVPSSGPAPRLRPPRRPLLLNMHGLVPAFVLPALVLLASPVRAQDGMFHGALVEDRDGYVLVAHTVSLDPVHATRIIVHADSARFVLVATDRSVEIRDGVFVETTYSRLTTSQAHQVAFARVVVLAIVGDRSNMVGTAPYAVREPWRTTLSPRRASPIPST